MFFFTDPEDPGIEKEKPLGIFGQETASAPKKANFGEQTTIAR